MASTKAKKPAQAKKAAAQKRPGKKTAARAKQPARPSKAASTKKAATKNSTSAKKPTGAKKPGSTKKSAPAAKKPMSRKPTARAKKSVAAQTTKARKVASVGKITNAKLAAAARPGMVEIVIRLNPQTGKLELSSPNVALDLKSPQEILWRCEKIEAGSVEISFFDSDDYKKRDTPFRTAFLRCRAGSSGCLSGVPMSEAKGKQYSYSATLVNQDGRQTGSAAKAIGSIRVK